MSHERARHGLDRSPNFWISQRASDLALDLLPFHVPAHTPLGGELGQGGPNAFEVRERSKERPFEASSTLGQRTGGRDHHGAESRIDMIKVASAAAIAM